MGSSKSPNQDMPFGYAFDEANSSFHYHSPPAPAPAPAPGPSLLDDHESNYLTSFFDDVSADHFNTDLFSRAEDGLDPGFVWHDIPPTFMGTSSSFGQQPLTSTNHNYQSSNYIALNEDLSHAGAHGTAPSPDVLAAAALLQNGHHRQPGQNGSYTSTSSLSRQSGSHSMSYGQGHMSSGNGKRDMPVQDNYFTEMMFGSTADMHTRVLKGAARAADLRWGSDAGFGTGQGFVAPAGQQAADRVEQNKMDILDCLEPHDSTADNTQPSSPVATRHPDKGQYEVRRPQGGPIEQLQDDEVRPRKRRKSEIKVEDPIDEDDGEVDEESISKVIKKKRPKSMGSATTRTAREAPTSKRRKSVAAATAAAAAAAKASRENLTEDQKRENHIKSEQKRRTLIKEGFDDLGELVPDLRNGGFSKSAVLVMAADFLEDLIKGNEILRARLSELDGK